MTTEDTKRKNPHRYREPGDSRRKDGALWHFGIEEIPETDEEDVMIEITLEAPCGFYFPCS